MRGGGSRARRLKARVTFRANLYVNCISRKKRESKNNKRYRRWWVCDEGLRNTEIEQYDL